MKSNYSLVKTVIESYEEKDILDEFLNTFEEGQNITKEQFIKLCKPYSEDAGDLICIEYNWMWIESEGDDNIFDDIN